eukprot:jgi/Bigna1/75972/fgenesh1_pg.38_\
MANWSTMSCDRTGATFHNSETLPSDLHHDPDVPACKSPSAVREKTESKWKCVHGTVLDFVAEKSRSKFKALKRSITGKPGFAGSGALCGFSSNEGQDKSMHVFDCIENSVASKKHGAGCINSVVVSPCGNCTASGACDGNLRIWNLKANLTVHTNAHSDWITTLAFSGNGRILASDDCSGTSNALHASATGICIENQVQTEAMSTHREIEQKPSTAHATSEPADRHSTQHCPRTARVSNEIKLQSFELAQSLLNATGCGLNEGKTINGHLRWKTFSHGWILCLAFKIGGKDQTARPELWDDARKDRSFQRHQT